MPPRNLIPQPANALQQLPNNLIPAPDFNNIVGQQIGKQVADQLPNISPQQMLQLPNAAQIIASCPPWSKPLINVHTQSAQPCSVGVKCPSGFTCYSNFPDGRNAQCCTSVPLDNQVVFKANSHMQPQMPSYSPPEGENSVNVPYGNGQVNSTEFNVPQNISVVIPALALPDNITLIRCPPGTVNISGVCKRSKFKYKF